MYLQTLLTSFALFQIVSSGCSGHNHHIGPQAHYKTAITNVLIWDGKKFGRQRSTVIIIDGVIADSTPVGASVINGNGGFLIPGLIDSHVQLTDCKQLLELQKLGITTALDLGTHPYNAVAKCGEHGLTDIRGSGAAGIVREAKPGLISGYAAESLLSSPEAGEAFVASRVAEEIDHILLSLDPLGSRSNDATIKAVVNAAHKAGLQVIAQATTHPSRAQAARTGVDIVTDVQFDKSIEGTVIDNSTSSNPSSSRFQSTITNMCEPFYLYGHAARSMNYPPEMSLVLAAGSSGIGKTTDSHVGEFLHEELARMVAAGFTPSQAIQAATSIPTSAFRIDDRGVIKHGMRADLVLLRADPTVDIGNLRSIVNVWVEGLSKR
ncbi:hypothetical protein WAI453_010360 [Rhynchosporium graminicola]|uniref:Amidohydrolase-related domain-containing protein n=1 Tax=Rhynchosporium graminicola TaxID=2792576 RepID=A0A1E1JTF7_9HELO|nr:uncharacterized protein RCO7_04721 [Rhynchosporium commune]